MSRKNKDLYLLVLEHIVRVLDETSPGQGFQIEVMISDFEPAILHAVKQTFPGNEKGCWSISDRLAIF